jgi:hypothetical protein
MFAEDSTRYASLKVDEWITSPLPSNAPVIESKRFEQVDAQRLFRGGTRLRC